MGRLFPLLALADLALIVVALIDCLSVEEFQIRALPRVVWVFLILLFSPVGPIAWFVAGRPERATAGTPDDPVLYSAPGRSTAPDDDPEFLGRIAARKRQEDEEMLRLWEADLRKREEELRKREQRPEDDDV
ncbi:MAG: PLDc_N domain-containing protein [Actinobacteria bacterium]|nr:MAG: PLDc_N domain-containing protein [Actinomycetota bacterium]